MFGIKKDHTKPPGLYRLSEIGQYEISPNNPDIRGWTLIGLDGERIGKVNELIVDTQEQKVRYLDIEVDHDIAKEKNHHILVPIGVARLHKNDDNVLVEGLSSATVNSYPDFDGQTITPEYEQLIRRSISNWRQPDAVRQISTDSEAYLEQSHQKLAQLRADLHTHEHASHLTSQPTERFTDAGTPSHDTEALRRAIAERDVAIKERDIARAERDILRLQLDNALAGTKDHSSRDDLYDDSKFYENRRK